jgi:iron complex outermembrane receptor protein
MSTRRYALMTASSTFALFFAHTGAAQTPAEGEDTLEQVVVTGTRVANRSALDTAAPVDVVSADQMQNTGVTEVNQALSVALPSFNFPRPGLADGTDTIRPATLRAVDRSPAGRRVGAVRLGRDRGRAQPEIARRFRRR